MFLVGAKNLEMLAKVPVGHWRKNCRMAQYPRLRHYRLCTESTLTLDIEKFLEQKAPLIDKAIEKYIPRKFSKNSVLFKVNPPMYSYNLEPLNKAIADPIWDMLDRGGKRWRPALFLLICEAFGKESDYCLDFTIIPEVIHNGTLVIDDIEDSSELRRGKPCTYKIFEMDIAVNAGNAMYYLPLLPLMTKRAKLSPEFSVMFTRFTFRK